MGTSNSRRRRHPSILPTGTAPWGGLFPSRPRCPWGLVHLFYRMAPTGLIVLYLWLQTRGQKSVAALYPPAGGGRGLGLAAVVVALSACSLLGSSDTPASGPSASPDPSVSATPSSAPPTLQPNGTAADNRAYFDYVNTRLIASNGDAKGADFVQALSAAGFDHSAITVTPDKTTTGLAADSIQFAVKFKNQCLIGQYGPKSNGYHSIVVPPISTGTCLIGQK